MAPITTGSAAPARAGAAADPYRRFRTVGTALALAILFVSAIELLRNIADPTVRDFSSFWAAGKLALAGDPAGAYDTQAVKAVQDLVARSNGGQMPFPYAPAFLLLVSPLALLPYPVAMIAWLAASFAAFVLVVRRIFPASGWLAAAFPPLFVNAATGQNGFATAAVMLGGLLLMPRRPFAAGLLLGTLALKPQLALLLPIAILAARQWRTIAGAAVSAVGLLLGGAVAFGPAVTLAWLDQTPLYLSIARDGLVGWHKLASVYAAARQLGAGQSAALAIHGCIALAAAVVTWRVWRSDSQHMLKASVLAAATMLASPYLFVYDAVLLVLPLLWLAGRGADARLVAALWCLPLFTVAQIYWLPGWINLMPVVPAALLALLWREHASGGSAQSLQPCSA